MAFRILWLINAVPAAIFGFFFIAGLADATVSPANIGLWLAILMTCFVTLGASLALRKAGRQTLANLLLTPGALGTVLAALFFVIVLISGGRWN